MASFWHGKLNKWLKIGDKVSTPQGDGEISQLRSECKYPIFVKLGSGKENCFYMDEISPISQTPPNI